MNKQNHLLLGAALLLAPVTATLGRSAWETEDALTFRRGMAIQPHTNGDLISLALANSTSGTGPVSTVVSLSIDHGATSQTVGSSAGYAVHLTAPPDGALFACDNCSGKNSQLICKAHVGPSV